LPRHNSKSEEGTPTFGNAGLSSATPRWAYHTDHGDEVHPDTPVRGEHIVLAKLDDGAESGFLHWEATFDKFIDCEVCIHEQLLLLSGWLALSLQKQHGRAAARGAVARMLRRQRDRA
jgi:hypothetical protein